MKSPSKIKPMTAGSPFDQIDRLCEGLALNDGEKKRPFALAVAVSGRIDSPGPRDPMWEYILDFGRDKIEDVLNLRPIGKGPHYFIYPDRWMVPAEGQQFIGKLEKNPDAAKFGRVTIVTKEPLICGAARAGELVILKKA